VGDRQRGERELDGAVLHGRGQAHHRLPRRDGGRPAHRVDAVLQRRLR
jgi:hypothetical protein